MWSNSKKRDLHWKVVTATERLSQATQGSKAAQASQTREASKAPQAMKALHAKAKSGKKSTSSTWRKWLKQVNQGNTSEIYYMLPYITYLVLTFAIFGNWSVHRLGEDFSHTKGSWLLNHQHYHCFCGIQWIWFELLNNFLGPFFRLCFHVIQFVNVAKFVESNDKFANNYYWNNTGITRKWKDFFPNGRCPWYFWCLCVVIFNHNGPSGDTAHHFSLLTNNVSQLSYWPSKFRYCKLSIFSGLIEWLDFLIISSFLVSEKD